MSGVFAGKSFVLFNLSPAQKKNLVKIIEDNGGHIGLSLSRKVCFVYDHLSEYKTTHFLTTDEMISTRHYKVEDAMQKNLLVVEESWVREQTSPKPIAVEAEEVLPAEPENKQEQFIPESVILEPHVDKIFVSDSEVLVPPMFQHL